MHPRRPIVVYKVHQYLWRPIVKLQHDIRESRHIVSCLPNAKYKFIHCRLISNIMRAKANVNLTEAARESPFSSPFDAARQKNAERKAMSRFYKRG